jgi:chaperonin GroEL
MQRALSSRARASVLSSAATKYRAGAGLSQQLRFAHKVRPGRLPDRLACSIAQVLTFLRAVGAQVRCRGTGCTACWC